MKKIIIFLVLVLGALQYCFSQQAFVWICQGGSYTWYFDASPTSEVVIRAIKNYGFGPDATTYDTIHDNKIILTPQVYTVYDIISIDGIPNSCSETLEIEVISPSATAITSNNTLSLDSITTHSMYGYPIYIHITTSNDSLLYHNTAYADTPIDIYNIPSGYYNIYLTTFESNCRVKINVTVL